eukprot:TRINITY_DN3353_c0_g1_i7.p1 TRINITY_DN3353_c0_g1~~TRINITY_DN3353_c0_g1_i7.p1  ORF type:complete len:229 (-),score=5.48 TRINITY_DN3353_c0_g1_i7:127-813(-)
MQNPKDCLAGKTNGEWEDEEMERLFNCYRLYDTKWSQFVHLFPGRSESNIKNKFYGVLKKVATQAQLEQPEKFSPNFIKSKKNLIQFVDLAITHGHLLLSKRGRKQNTERATAMEKPILFPLKRRNNRESKERLVSRPEPSPQPKNLPKAQIATSSFSEFALLAANPIPSIFLAPSLYPVTAQLSSDAGFNGSVVQHQMLGNIAHNPYNLVYLPYPAPLLPVNTGMSK